MKCAICGKEYKGLTGIGKHVAKHGITAKDYYDKYVKEDPQEGYCLNCGVETSFRGMNIGYSKFCSGKCQMSLDEYRKIPSESRKKFWREDPRATQVKEKISESVKERWNEEDSVFNSEEYRNRLSERQSERWGKEKSRMMESVFPEYGYELVDDEYQNAHYYHNWKCLNCGYIFNTVWNNIQPGKQCPNCEYTFGKPTSKMERELATFISNLGFNVYENSKRIIPPQELDLYIPELNIGIELDGLYWHSDDKKDKNYHLNKTEECEKNGIQLIHIFEDEWMFNKGIVLERLKQILGCNNNLQKINARECYIKEIDSKTKNNFLSEFHLQGKDASVIKLGSFYNDELVAVMTFSYGNISKGSRPQEGIWELNRFCTNYHYHMPGIASKLLEYFKRNYNWTKIFSYADRRWSQGNLYRKLGFEEIHKTKPNYWYISRDRRIHRFNLRKSNNEGNLSEQTIRRNEGYSVIWDCGNIKFELTK